MAASLLAAAAAVAAVPPTRVEVKNMPGWDGPLPSRTWSGFVSGGTPPSGVGTQYYHYLMVEAEENPATAPTVFWYNGGPGASSLFGLFQELGPLYLNEWSEKTEAYNKTGIPTPMYNPATWSKKFNLFAVSSPAPVGWSFCTEDGPSGKGTSCGTWTDEDVFTANKKVIVTLMNDVFPELRKNELYVTGESYAGIYVPGIVNEILADKEPQVNIKGYAVGDGCMGNDVGCAGPLYDVMFFGGHGQVSNELYNKIRAECPRADLCSGKLSAACETMVATMRKQIGGYYVYDLYDDCPTNQFTDVKMRHKAKSRHMTSQQFGGALNDYACSGTAMNDYIARAEVKTAFGVPQDDYFFNADNGQGFNYKSTVNDVRPFHRNAIRRGLRVLAYEGDADACGLAAEGFLQDTYTEFWPSIGLKKTEDWRPWTVDGKKRMGGYCMEWGNGQASWITVRGSGHMVPLNKPDQAATMINAFVFNTGYPKLN